MQRQISKEAKLPALWKRYKKDEIKDAIVRNYGVVTNICKVLDCTYRQLYLCLDKYGLRPDLDEAKKELVSMAESQLISCLNSENENIKMKAVELTLKSLGKDTWGQTPQVQITQNVVSDEEKKIEIKNIFGITQ